ncbi:DUF6660 family protein [Flavobacterium sp.]|uniref:DUF6660 family protein n=1 Tax=Flavobacterium sp. TaxID=239 RepID=UPI0035AF6CB6
MKLLTVILSIYLVTLSAIPCADIKSESEVHLEVAQTSDKDNHSHDKGNDLCSPFCICNCCGQVTLNYVATINYDFPVQFEEIKSSKSTYTSALHSNFFGSIWQPPQLV